MAIRLGGRVCRSLVPHLALEVVSPTLPSPGDSRSDVAPEPVAGRSSNSGGPGGHHDVLVVGGGPAGSSCAYWLAEAGWDVALVEKKVFPRVKTCGDGLTPRSVRQIADMGLEGALTGAHRYTGLRAHAFGRVLDLPWPEHPSFPSYGYVITRHDLDGIVNDRAVKAGATVWQGTEAVEPILDDARGAGVSPGRPSPPASGPWSRTRPPAPPGPSGPGTWWWPTGPTRDSDGPSGRHATGSAHGHGPSGLLHLARPRPAVHRIAPRHQGR